MLGRELELEPQVVVTVLQVSEELTGVLADLFDRAAVQLAALLHAGPPEALHLVAIALRVHTLARQREDGFDRGGLWCFKDDTTLRRRRLCWNEWQLVITLILERIIAVAVPLRQLHLITV